MIRLIAVVLFICGVQSLVRFLYEPYDKSSIYARQEYKQERGKVDMVFLGTSQSYTAFDPELIDERLGVNSFNLGTNAQLLLSSRQLLREALEINPVETVYLEVNIGGLVKDKNDSSQLGAFDRMISSKGKLATLLDTKSNNLRMRQIFYSVRALDLFDLEKLKENVAYKTGPKGGQVPIKPKKNQWQYYSKGHLASTMEYNAEKNKDKKKASSVWNREKIKPASLDNLRDIIELCKDKGVELIFVTPALNPQVASYAGEQQDFYNFVKEIADANGISYYNMNLLKDRDDIFDYGTFRDYVHLNKNGATVFSDIISDLYENPDRYEEYFTDSYQLPDLPV